MNRIISMAIALIMAINMNAQEGYEDTKHEVSITFGIEPTSQRIDNFKNLGGAIGYTDNDKYMEPISAEYFYHINKMLSLGAVFVYGNLKQDLYDRYSYSSYRTTLIRERIGKSSNNYYTLLPTVKFNFLRKTHFGLYSKAALGATLRTESVKYNDEYYDVSKKVLILNCQFSLIGVEAGSPYLRGFAELGFGEQGVVCAGIRYKF